MPDTSEDRFNRRDFVTSWFVKQIKRRGEFLAGVISAFAVGLGIVLVERHLSEDDQPKHEFKVEISVFEVAEISGEGFYRYRALAYNIGDFSEKTIYFSLWVTVPMEPSTTEAGSYTAKFVHTGAYSAEGGGIGTGPLDRSGYKFERRSEEDVQKIPVQEAWIDVLHIQTGLFLYVDTDFPIAAVEARIQSLETEATDSWTPQNT